MAIEISWNLVAHQRLMKWMKSCSHILHRKPKFIFIKKCWILWGLNLNDLKWILTNVLRQRSVVNFLSPRLMWENSCLFAIHTTKREQIGVWIKWRNFADGILWCISLLKKHCICFTYTHTTHTHIYGVSSLSSEWIDSISFIFILLFNQLEISIGKCIGYSACYIRYMGSCIQLLNDDK